MNIIEALKIYKSKDDAYDEIMNYITRYDLVSRLDALAKRKGLNNSYILSEDVSVWEVTDESVIMQCHWIGPYQAEDQWIIHLPINIFQAEDDAEFSTVVGTKDYKDAVEKLINIRLERYVDRQLVIQNRQKEYDDYMASKRVFEQEQQMYRILKEKFERTPPEGKPSHSIFENDGLTQAYLSGATLKKETDEVLAEESFLDQLKRMED